MGVWLELTRPRAPSIVLRGQETRGGQGPGQLCTRRAPGARPAWAGGLAPGTWPCGWQGLPQELSETLGVRRAQAGAGSRGQASEPQLGERGRAALGRQKGHPV